MVAETIACDFSCYLEKINHTLGLLVPENSSSHRHLYEAARYALLGPGKRIRPLLTMATAELFGISHEVSLVPACAIELIHAYSMIHDDLPCMDNDDYRRGRPTLHRIYSEAVALLAGDFLLTKAFESLSQTEFLSAQQKLQFIQKLSYAAGGECMIGGQLIDISCNPLSLISLQSLHQKKTGALILVALEFGCILGNASAIEIELLTKCGKELGIAFQIVDDILDVTASVEKHGKLVSSDITNQKTTYVSLLGLEEAKNSALLHLTNCKSYLSHFPNSEFLLSIMESIFRKIA